MQGWKRALRARMIGTATLVAMGAAIAALTLSPASAHGSPRQLSLMQDDPAFRGDLGDPQRWFAEARGLGVDVIRMNLYWRDVAPGERSTRKPAGHAVEEPSSPGYRWEVYDRALANAERHGLRMLFTLTGPIPYWASEQPRHCARARRQHHCTWRPDPVAFGRFVEAAARRYRGRVWMWSLWNEPNLSSWLSPQLRRTRQGKVRWAGRMYRRLWWEGWQAIATADPSRRRRVLFGETAPTHDPVPLLRSALCLDERGRPYRGRQRIGQGCSRKPRRLPIAGVAHHPYTPGGVRSPRLRVRSRWQLTTAYLPRLHALIRGAARHNRMRRRPVYLTEHGFQSRPPDRYAPSLRTQARWINESDRLFYGDRRVRSVAQYELIDPPERGVFNTGLRRSGGARKPAWTAYRMPIVVTRRSASRVAVWGQARPARGRARVSVYAKERGRSGWRRIARRRTNPQGFLRLVVHGRGEAARRYQLRWRAPGGTVIRSRSALARAPLRYRR